MSMVHAGLKGVHKSPGSEMCVFVEVSIDPREALGWSLLSIYRFFNIQLYFPFKLIGHNFYVPPCYPGHNSWIRKGNKPNLGQTNSSPGNLGFKIAFLLHVVENEIL